MLDCVQGHAEIDTKSGAAAADAPASESGPLIDLTVLSNLLLAGPSWSNMEAILTDTMSGGLATKFHQGLEAILETRDNPNVEKLKEAVDMVCTMLKWHIADMIQREVLAGTIHHSTAVCQIQLGQGQTSETANHGGHVHATVEASSARGHLHHRERPHQRHDSARRQA